MPGNHSALPAGDPWRSGAGAGRRYTTFSYVLQMKTEDISKKALKRAARNFPAVPRINIL